MGCERSAVRRAKQMKSRARRSAGSDNVGFGQEVKFAWRGEVAEVSGAAQFSGEFSRNAGEEISPGSDLFC